MTKPNIALVVVFGALIAGLISLSACQPAAVEEEEASATAEVKPSGGCGPCQTRRGNKCVAINEGGDCGTAVCSSATTSTYGFCQAGACVPFTEACQTSCDTVTGRCTGSGS